MTSCLLSSKPIPFSKGTTLGDKNLPFLGVNLFLIEQTPFQKGYKTF